MSCGNLGRTCDVSGLVKTWKHGAQPAVQDADKAVKNYAVETAGSAKSTRIGSNVFSNTPTSINKNRNT